MNGHTSRRPFRFGVNHVTTSLQEWQDVARKAEALGFATLIAQDHFGAQLAPLPSLVAAGAVTSTLRLGTIVLDNDFRHPAVVAKEAATVDVLTQGRLELGLGAGWLAADYAKTGLAFDPPAQRLARLAEAVQICKAFFAGPEAVTFQGAHYQLEKLDALPRPVQSPRPPIMIGGRQRRMLTLAAREADIVGISLLDRRSPGDPPAPSFSQKAAWVRESAADRFEEIEIHINVSAVEITDDRDGVLDQIATRTGASIGDVQRSPGVLVGSPDGLGEQLHAMREQFGVSYYVIQGRVMDTLAPLVHRLAGT